MANYLFTFQPGEFVRVHLPSGSCRVGRIHGVTNNNLSVSWWSIDNSVEVNANELLLPPHLVDAGAGCHPPALHIITSFCF
jgi:hypothetical protein